MGLTSSCLAIRAGLIVAALMLGGCTATRPDAESNLQARLDALHADDVGAWREEMGRLLLEGGESIPERHLGIAIATFNAERDLDLWMQTAWLYLKHRRGAGPNLGTDRDRSLLRTYAELALKSPDAKHTQRLETLCHTLVEEPACAGD